MTDADAPWPFERQDPDRVVLGPRAGATPSEKDPVRIYLGTEEAQYRAERVFFYAIEKVRDPGRTYEVYLMKNIKGFDRSRWRTGFTNYRYAIPSFAGGTGRAIYNDVDQIYLADPALLFDLDMGAHGYLAISAKDTSVMLIDCGRMLPVWNRDAAAVEGKHALINKPASEPGLWGKLDPHWNARDMEYVEGLTKCLHYTALHQQPWHPFPESYSYHPNPLAYVWYDLEREADASGYQVFTADRPSPDYAERLASAAGLSPQAGPGLSASARDLAKELGVESALVVRAIDAMPAPEGLLDAGEVERFRLAPGAAWPKGRFDAVGAQDLLEHLPPADLPWVLRALFERARKLVHVALPATAAVGLGSGDWWRQRLEEAAQAFPRVSWHLDVAEATGAEKVGRAHASKRLTAAKAPLVWALIEGDPGRDAQVRRLADALGWDFKEKRLAYKALSKLPNLVRGAGLSGLDRDRSDALHAPWPDLLLAAGRRAAGVAAWVKQQGGGRTRIVQLGRPEAGYDLFDLIVAQPQHRLPVRGNVLHVTAPLALRNDAAAKALVARWAEILQGQDVPAPRSLLVLGPGKAPYVVDARVAGRFAERARARLDDVGGGLVVWIEPDTGEAARRALLERLGPVPVMSDHDLAGEAGAREALVRAADRAMLLGDDVDLLAAACAAAKPVDLFEPPQRVERLPGGRAGRHLLALALGGGTSYRGTPMQQHGLSRLLDRAVVKGLVRPVRDLRLLHRALAARGLLVRLDDERVVATRRPLNDLDRVVERVRRLMREERPQGAA